MKFLYQKSESLVCLWDISIITIMKSWFSTKEDFTTFTNVSGHHVCSSTYNLVLSTELITYIGQFTNSVDQITMLHSPTDETTTVTLVTYPPSLYILSTIFDHFQCPHDYSLEC